MAEHSESQHKTQRRAGLGRGLGALIPQAQSENPEEVAKRPLDVLFPGQRSSTTTRGGSARELLEPKSRKSTSARGSGAPKTTRTRKSQDPKVQEASEGGARGSDFRLGIGRGRVSK